MKIKSLLSLAAITVTSIAAAAPVEVRVRQTPAGPGLFVDGQRVRPRFYYGSPACLCNISHVDKRDYVIPFRADADTDKGQVAIDGFLGDDPMWFSNARLVDLTAGTTNAVSNAAEKRTRHFRQRGLKLVKGHLYRFVVTHRATHFRTYFTQEVSYRNAAGKKVVLPLPYGDTLGETAALAADGGVDLITFSTDTSWGCEGWWSEDGGESGYGKIDRLCEALIARNPKALLIPRVKADAPSWMLRRHPEMKMRFASGMVVEMSSVSSRPYRQAACEQIEKLTRHLRRRFPRNFAGLHVSGQNSAEWFYMLSQTEDLSGYDDATRDAFREWMRRKGDPTADTLEVPTEAERKSVSNGFLRDEFRDRRALDFHRFRQEEMATFLRDLGRAVRRGSDNGSLALFFYGYSWELGAVRAGAAETGHFALEWLMENAADCIDGFSAPISYSNRSWPNTAPVMSAAETILRKGFLWINENDNRTHHEDIWDHMDWAPHDDPWMTRNAFLRDSAVQILRGYGDWWMDLFGRGWFRDPEVWKVRQALNPLDDLMLKRKRPYSPDIAVCVNEESFLYLGWGSGAVTGPALNRRGFETCGVTYGQYFLNDLLDDPPDAKVFYIAVGNNLDSVQRNKLRSFKVSHPDAVFVENVTAMDVTSVAIAAAAARANAHRYTRPGAACVNAAEGFVVVTAMDDGPLAIDFGNKGDVIDCLTKKKAGVGPTLTFDFRKGETRIFQAK